MAYTAVPCVPHATISQRIAFLHAILGSPILSTLCQSLDAGYLNFVPEITALLVRKYPLPSIAMLKGHLDQVHMNQRSTLTVQVPPPLPTTQHPIATTPTLPLLHLGSHTHSFYATCCSATGQFFANQTSKFPIKSTASNTDMFILFNYDSNSIHVKPMPLYSGYQILLIY